MKILGDIASRSAVERTKFCNDTLKDNQAIQSNMDCGSPLHIDFRLYLIPTKVFIELSTLRTIQESSTVRPADNLDTSNQLIDMYLPFWSTFPPPGH